MPAGRVFATTRWSVVLRAGADSQEAAQVALEQLCRDYWYPLYAYVRRKGYSPEDASDLTQDFFAKLIANDFAQGLSPEGGRFRSFLLTSLNRFLINGWEKGRRLRRGGGVVAASLDALILERGEAGYLGEFSTSDTPAFGYCTNLTSVHFQGDAPSTPWIPFTEDGHEDRVFSDADNLTIHHHAAASGWSESFRGYPTLRFSDPDWADHPQRVYRVRTP